jgi:hypothetical protein
MTEPSDKKKMSTKSAEKVDDEEIKKKLNAIDTTLRNGWARKRLTMAPILRTSVDTATHFR